MAILQYYPTMMGTGMRGQAAPNNRPPARRAPDMPTQTGGQLPSNPMPTVPSPAMDPNLRPMPMRNTMPGLPRGPVVPIMQQERRTSSTGMPAEPSQPIGRPVGSYFPPRVG